MADEHPPVTADFAETLRRARRAAGLSQEELAERAGLSARAISDLERGVNRAPRRDTLDLLGDALALTPGERRRWEQLRRQMSIRAPGQSERQTGQSANHPTESGTTEHNTLLVLPPQPTRFFGRGSEIKHLAQLLDECDSRLVTLTGPGGSGKTRLAVELAIVLADRYPDGVVFVDLAPVRDAELVPSTIAAALGVRPRTGEPLMATIGQWLEGKRLLLVLDNLEQILDAAMDISTLIDRSSSVQVVATSRAPLRLRAEREFPVPPLPLPVFDDSGDPESDTDSYALRLFIDRARAVRPEAVATSDDLRAAATICHRLDGLPLAIELAAASIRMFSPVAILSRIEQHLPLAAGSRRDAPARQRTLRDTIAWSYDLLSSDDQALFRRLSVFRGGWTIEAAEALVATEGESPNIDVLQGLETLTEQSLIQSSPWIDGSPRFSMLETIREFGLSQLDATGESNAVHQLHASFFARIFTGSERDWHVPRGRTWLQRGDAELDNVRLALEWAVVHDPVTALRLAREFAWIWFMRGAFLEAQGWLERGLETATDAPDELRAGALWWFGGNMITAGEYAAARTPTEEALAIYLNLGHDIGIAECYHSMARLAMFSGNPAEAVSAAETAANLFREHGDPTLPVTLVNLVSSLIDLGKLDAATHVIDEALAYAERQHRDPWLLSMLLNLQGEVAFERADFPQARSSYARGLHVCRDVRDPRFVAQVLEWCAFLAVAEGAATHAAQLLGSVRRMREIAGTPVPLNTQRRYDHYVPLAQAQIGSDEWHRAWSEGYALTQAEAIGVALTGVEGV